MKIIEAIIYDVDGTLVNSEPLHVSAWDSALHQYGSALGNLSSEFVQKMAGKKPIVIATEMVEVLGLPIKPDVLLQRKTADYLDLASSELKPMDGAIESIKLLGGAGYRLAIGTSLDRLLLGKILSHLGVENDFEVKVTGDQIKQGKPNPETYNKVAELLGVPPEACLVFEDAQSGIQSAKAAGMWCIAVENPDAIKQDTSDADRTLNSFAEVTPEFVEQLYPTGDM